MRRAQYKQIIPIAFMLKLAPTVISSLLVALSVNAATSCPPTSSDLVSCSTEADGQDACCVPSPGGTFLFKQRFEPDKGDEGRWGIDGLDVLDCSSTSVIPQKPTAPRAYSHEEIGSFCTTSPTFGAEYETWEAEWAESEVGEGLEEIWERAWRTGGRSISTLEPRCFDDYVVGEEVPLFFDSIHHLHQSLSPWRLLADSDITPSEGITYSRAEITNALTVKTGFEPYVSCVNETISTIFWPVHVKGKFQDSRFVAAKDVQVTHVESCPEEGIHYPSIPNVPRAAPSHTWDPITRPSPRSLSQEAIERSQNQGRRSDGDDEDAAPHAAHDKAVNVERLGFFKRADGKREEGKDQEDGWGQRKGTVRDEL